MLPAHLEPVAAIGLPALMAAICTATARMARKPAAGATPGGIGWAGIALAISLGIAVLLLRGWSGFPPTNLHDWPMFIALGAALLAAVANLRLAWFAALSLVLIGAALPVLLTIPLRGWSAFAAAGWFAVFGIAWLGLVLGARSTATRLPTPALAAWAGALAVTGWLIADPVTAKHHGFCLAGAGVGAGLLALANLLWQERIAGNAVAVALAVLVPTWLLLAHTLTANLPAIALLPLAAAPLTAWIAWPLRNRPWAAAIVAFIVAAGIAALAIPLVNVPPPEAVGW